MLALRSWTSLVHQMRDDAGRPLGEHRALEHTGTVPMELVPCLYPGSRSSAGKPINVSALRETIKHWRPALGLLARAHSEVPVSTAMDVWWAGQLAESLPYLTLFRHGGRPEGIVIPGPVAAAYKAMLGTNAGILGFVLDHPPSPAPGVPAVDEILAHVEEHRLLVGPEQACAGPEPLIRETLSVLIHGGPRSEEADRLFDAHPDAVVFGKARASLLVTRMAFGLSTHAIFADLLADLAQRDVPRELGEAIARVGVGEPTRDQERFSGASHTGRLARLRSLAQHAVAGEEFLRAAERVLAPDFAGEQPAPDSLSQAAARQELLEEACRSWIAEIKRRITHVLPDDPRRDRELALSTVSLPAQTPLRRLMTILTGPPRGVFS
jgi:hypothetical protein